MIVYFQTHQTRMALSVLRHLLSTLVQLVYLTLPLLPLIPLHSPLQIPITLISPLAFKHYIYVDSPQEYNLCFAAGTLDPNPWDAAIYVINPIVDINILINPHRPPERNGGGGKGSRRGRELSSNNLF